ncbi:PAS domain-containing protein [Chondromyces crocatus]|uniref:STAS domain-containing protein n=1 Tax=Chondromyces crocatus TaxID=52 RepID=A0A0K1EKG8_CHOCO|nr:PAS domain-containing protein [Chondromyces crocatus]AKT41361.1 uncharacterized protein CMC5_055610 [Chondromyces crocatus]
MSNHPPNAQEAELLALRAQLAECQAEREQLRTALQCTRDALRTEQEQAIQLLMNLPAAICYFHGPELVIGFANARYVDLSGNRDLIGKPVLEALPELEAQGFAALLQQVYRTGEPYIGVAAPGQTILEEGVDPADRWYDVVYQPVRDTRGQVDGVLAQVTDVTERVLGRLRLDQLSSERAALQEELILTQQAALRELATPLVPVADGVIAMPLVGTIDTERAGHILEALLEGVSEQRAHVALLDVTGVRTMDEQVATALLRTARAAQLLGAEVVLTGLGPGVAQALVSLGVDFGGITTLRSLQAGIHHALRRRTNRRKPQTS